MQRRLPMRGGWTAKEGPSMKTDNMPAGEVGDYALSGPPVRQASQMSEQLQLLHAEFIPLTLLRS